MDNNQAAPTKQKEKASVSQIILTVVGIVLCVILLPILIVNSTLLIKGWIEPDKVPNIGGYFPMMVLSPSMTGEINDGDLIIGKEVDTKEIKVDDVITYYDPREGGDMVITHRVIEVTTTEDGQLGFRTKGDFNGSEDPVVLPADKVIGRWTGIVIRGGGDVAEFMQTPAGMAICIGVPLLLIALYEILQQVLKNKKSNSDKDALMQELEELRKLKAQQAGADAEAAAPVTDTFAQADPPAAEAATDASEDTFA